VSSVARLGIRDWRWTWLALAFRWSLTIAVLVPLLPLFLLAKGFAAAYDWLVDLTWTVQVRAHNLDRARRGDFSRIPAPELGSEWKGRVR
jgi:hypothetical protein